MTPQEHAQAARKNLVGCLRIMEDDVKRMLKGGTGRTLKFASLAGQLSECDMAVLRHAALRIESAIGWLLADETVALDQMKLDFICDCEIHVQSFREIGIVTLEEFFRSDSFNRKYAIHKSEQKGGKRQLHLYSDLWRRAIPQDEVVANVSSSMSRFRVLSAAEHRAELSGLTHQP